MSTTADYGLGSSGSQPWKDVLVDLLPSQGNWSDEQYLALTDSARRPVEFTDGVLEPLPMPTDKHQSIVKFLLYAFDRFMAPLGGKVLFSPLRLRIRPGKYREPDLMVLRSEAVRAEKTAIGPALISWSKSSAPMVSSATRSKSAPTTPRPACRNTGS